MRDYNDWALMNEINQTLAQKEYKILSKSYVFSMESDKNITKIFEKIAYLLSLISILKKHNKNKDIDTVLEDIEIQIKKQIELLHVVFNESTKVLENNFSETRIFCNNLKLSIQVCLEIINILLSYQNKNKKIKDIIDEFFDITKKYVSLFGECEYRIYVNKYRK